MPRRGKRPQLKLMQAQKKFIESRLMQISLTVDNYIYKNIPIIAANADKYLKEISGYKAICVNNQRSLQVIEKLTRIMRRIIEEEKDLQHSQAVKEDTSDINLIDTQTVIAAPVDEDLTQFSQVNIERNIELPTIIQSNNVAKSSKDKTNKQKTCKENMRNNIDKFLTTSLYKDISKLTICDKEDPKLDYCSQECSQSILSNFESVNTFQNTGVNATKNSKGFEKVIKSITIEKKYNTRGIKIPTPKRTRTRKRVDRVTASKIAHNQPEQEVTSCKNEMIMEEKLNVKTYEAVKRKCNKSVEKQNKQSAKQETKRAKADMKLIDLSIEASQNYKFPHTLNANCMPKTTKETDQNNITLENFTNAVETQSNLILVNNENPEGIYNEQVANNLSWIENIRFVREISKEEYFPAYFDDNFWNDYSLPLDFNEKEFLH